MHGSSPGGLAFVANAELNLMGGIADCGGFDIETKTSPRRAAIEKAQTELRQEYDAREERKKELEFLEKGGNPLDFKLSHGASVSLQSTSFTDHQAEQYVISEAKGSFALDASPHGDGDSVESSGRPVGGSAGREPNFADNLLLFEGENSNPGGDKKMKRTGKRGNVSINERSSLLDRCNNTKETEDSLASHHGVKSQAYARRNRSRPSHSTKSPTPSSFPRSKNEKGLLQEAQAEDHAISSLSNLKPVSPNFASDNHMDMELDGRKFHDANSDMVKDKVQEGETEVGISETARDTNRCNQHTDAKSKQVANCTNSRSSDVIGKGEASSAGFLLPPQEPTNFKDISSSERNSGLGIPDKVVTDAHSSDPIRKTSAVGGVSQVLSLGNVKTDTDGTDKIKDGITDSNTFAIVKTVDSSSNGDPKELTVLQGATDNNEVRKTSQLISVNEPLIGADESRSSHSSLNKSEVQVKDEVELCDNITEVSNEIRPLHKTESVKPNGESVSKPERKPSNSVDDSSHSINKAGVITSTLVLPTCESSSTFCKRGATVTSAVQNCAASNLKLSKKLREDAILKEARTIEVNLKRAGELSTCYMSLERRTKCHWDFVLEEMAWMANDFMQEHLWKKAVAAHVCHEIASNSRTKYEQDLICQKQRSIARTLAISVMNFWHSADLSQTAMDASSGVNGDCTSDIFKSCKTNGTEAERKEGSQYVKSENHHVRLAIQAYAIRFLKYDKDTFNLPVLAEAPTTPDRIHDTGVLEMSWEDQLSEESLFYSVPPGAMQAYREAVESQWVNHKKMGNSVHPEDCDTSVCDSVPDGPRDYVYEEEEGETGPYFLPGAIEGSLSSKLTHKKRKHLHQNSYGARLYDAGSDLSYDPCLEGTSANQALVFLGKSPSSSLNVGSIPTKRVRTAARPRVVSPFSAGITGSLQVTSKTDVSSGDTNSLQDDQSSMHGGSQSRKNMEVESTMDFEKHVPSDSIETSTKSKKKKKTKHGYTMNLTDSCVLVVSGKGSLLDQRLQVDSVVQQEQRDHVKRSQHFEPKGNIGIYGQHVAKKPKLLKQLTEPSPDAIMPGTGSLPSPAASQMSNMSNQQRFIKIIANRDRGRKSKAMKLAVGQSGSGIPWTNFEDQALVVLVHDMGPNWELVSDAINSTLQFKCIFRKPKDCKERHKYLMDKSAGDGADSAEDSGSSQPYPSTLPGIPKGSARQLFQHLQGPIVEDVLRTHFEKIILIRQQLHPRKSQNDKKELKQIIPVHSSHVALSQACPNNLAGGVLTPLDLCDATASSSDALALGYQGSHTSGAAIPTHQGSVSPVLSSGVNTSMQGSPGIVLSSNLPSPSTPINVPSRDSQRYCMPRTTSLPVDDQQRMHYNQMLSGRNAQQSSMSAPGALPVGVDRGVRMLPGANGVGMMGGRNMPITRPGFQGMSAPGMLSMVSNGSMLAGSGVGMTNSVNVHPSSVSTPANSMMRPREALQILRPSQNVEDHRQMMMQVSQVNAQAVPPFNGISAPFSTATGLPSVQPYSGQQHQQSHQMPQQPHMLGNPHHPHIQGTTNQSSAKQQAYAIRFAKERQHQRMLSQPQQPYSGSSTMSSMQNNSQPQQKIQPSSSVTPAPSSQVQHNKQQILRNPQSSSGTSNQMMKQRLRPQVPQQQQPRHQQKQLMHQQPKHIKGLGRGSMIGHPNLPVDPSQVNGLSVATRNPVSEKPVMQQDEGFFSPTSGLNPNLTQSSNHNVMFTRPPSQSSKQIPQLPSNSDTCNQGPLQVSTNSTSSAPQQPRLPTSLPLANVPLQQQHRQMNPNVPRLMLTQNRPLTSDGKIQASADQVNQLVPASLPRCADSTGSASVTSSTTQWKPDSPYDTSTQAPPAHLAGSPQEGLVGTDSSVPPSSEEMAQRQFSGSVLPHVHGVGGQWVQQHQIQQQQQKQQSQHRQTNQGNSYALPSNSRPGG